MSVQRLDTNRRMSQAVVHGGTIYLSGQVADDSSADHTWPDAPSTRKARYPVDSDRPGEGLYSRSEHLAREHD
jgi:hypothetical protein